MNTEEASSALQRSIADLCRDFSSGAYTPILEADIAAYLYHRLLTNGCSPNTVYLASRICGESARTRKPDLVIGKLETERACVRPALIGELKAFQRWGLSDQQMRRRFERILHEDIPTLEEMSCVLARGRVQIVADFFVSKGRRGYLTGKWNGVTRIDVIASACQRIGASLIWLRPTGEDKVGFEVVV